MEDQERALRELILRAIAQRVATHAEEERHWQRIATALQTQLATCKDHRAAHAS